MRQLILTGVLIGVVVLLWLPPLSELLCVFRRKRVPVRSSRNGEVSRLLLSDFDWRQEVFVVNHSKRRGSQRFPLRREVGDAILHYLQEARPRCAC